MSPDGSAGRRAAASGYERSGSLNQNTQRHCPSDGLFLHSKISKPALDHLAAA